MAEVRTTNAHDGRMPGFLRHQISTRPKRYKRKGKSRARPTALRLAAIALMTFGPALQAHAASEMELLLGAAPVTDTELALHRGGSLKINNITFTVSVEKKKTVNGTVEFHTYVVASGDEGWSATETRSAERAAEREEARETRTAERESQRAERAAERAGDDAQGMTSELGDTVPVTVFSATEQAFGEQQEATKAAAEAAQDLGQNAKTAEGSAGTPAAESAASSAAALADAVTDASLTGGTVASSGVEALTGESVSGDPVQPSSATTAETPEKTSTDVGAIVQSALASTAPNQTAPASNAAATPTPDQLASSPSTDAAGNNAMDMQSPLASAPLPQPPAAPDLPQPPADTKTASPAPDITMHPLFSGTEHPGASHLPAHPLASSTDDPGAAASAPVLSLDASSGSAPLEENMKRPPSLVTFEPPSPAKVFESQQVVLITSDPILTRDLVRQLLSTPTVVTNHENNAVIEEFTKITVNIDNFSALSADILREKMSATVADLVRQQVTFSLTRF